MLMELRASGDHVVVSIAVDGILAVSRNFQTIDEDTIKEVYSDIIDNFEKEDG